MLEQQFYDFFTFKYKNIEKYKNLVEALHSQEVLNAAKDLFKGQALPAWK